MNQLYYGDNLDVLRRHVPDESVDLVYLDPPFNSNTSYNVLFAERDGTQAASQIKAFEDKWRWDEGAACTYEDVVEAGGRVSQAMQAFRMFLGESNMLAYLAMMAPRLAELHRVLKPTGTLYLHCDPTASHYLKMLTDAVFQPAGFLNEIAWCYNVGGKSKRHWARKHDVLLFYAKGADWFFDGEAVGVARETGVKSFGGKIGTDEEGRRFQDKLVKATGKYYRYYLDKPKIPEDWWVGINSIQSQAAERLGYPTQKPEALLQRIIRSSCPDGGTVLDPFCGCGTTIAAAQHFDRLWIGIDVTHLAIGLIRHRLRDAYGDNIEGTYEVIGEPVSQPDAAALAAFDPYQFQWWALGLIGARPAEGKKGADKGIDGRVYFHDDNTGETKQIAISVKAGKLHAPYIRDLRGVMDRENAEMGVLLSLEKPTAPMRKEAASAGFYESHWGTKHPRLQIVTVGELLNSRRLDAPPRREAVTFKRAPRALARVAETRQVPLGEPKNEPTPKKSQT